MEPREYDVAMVVAMAVMVVMVVVVVVVVVVVGNECGGRNVTGRQRRQATAGKDTKEWSSEWLEVGGRAFQGKSGCVGQARPGQAPTLHAAKKGRWLAIVQA